MKDNNLISGLIIEKSKYVQYYTYMDEIFGLIGKEAYRYNWLITNIECNKETDRFIYPFEEQYIEGKELKDYLNNNKIQFIWGVFTGINKKIRLSKEELLSIKTPYADENKKIWEPPVSIQHPLGDIEIICCDSTLTIIKSKNKDVIHNISSTIKDARDLKEYIEKLEFQ